MKILCICREGIYRSVATKRELNKRGFNDVISVGGLMVSQETLNMLCKWADMILLAKPEHGEKIVKEYQNKINKDFYIGSDMKTIVKNQLNLIWIK